VCLRQSNQSVKRGDTTCMTTMQSTTEKGSTYIDILSVLHRRRRPLALHFSRVHSCARVAVILFYFHPIPGFCFLNEESSRSVDARSILISRLFSLHE